MRRKAALTEPHSQLDDFKALTRSNLATIAQSLAAGKPFPAVPAVRDEKAFQAGPSTLPFANPSNITAFQLSSAFFAYQPCLISQDAVGASATAVALNIVPEARSTLVPYQALYQGKQYFH